MADVKVIGRRGPGTDGRAVPARPSTAAGAKAPVQVIGVGASTGGPAALYRFLEVLPAQLPVPVLVVQHIPDGFVAGLVRWLQTATTLPVQVAAHGQPLRDGGVLIAPHGRHLVVDGGDRVALSDAPPAGGFRPSVSVLFSSLAERVGAAAVGVVLTGMGNDGLDGARRLREAGGLVLAQDEATSVVFGMPRAVADAGLASGVGTVDELSRRVGELACAARPRRPS
jgi:two-component system chemotaxis response regulator CheB